MDKGLEMGSWVSLIVKIGIVLCERDYYIPDLSSESPSLRAASICWSWFSPLQHLFAHSVLMVCRVLHALM